jgi:two-component system, chemotaxis family, sensor kinase CheA
MEQFKKKFLEEANDLINSLEDVLLLLEEKPTDKKIIEEVFRVMHSLKGGSSMFGFDKMDAFTHELETVYDLIRNDALTVNREILDITLASVDHLKTLLVNSEDLSGAHLKNHQLLLTSIHKISNKSEKVEKPDNEVSETKEINNGVDSNEKFAVFEAVPTYFISVKPQQEIFRNGTNPLLLIDELHTLGHCKAYLKTSNLPDLAAIDPEKCYFTWEVFLATDNTTDFIKDVFIFVDDVCSVTIKKIAEDNLLAKTLFINGLDDFMKSDKETSSKDLKTFVDSVHNTQSHKDEDVASIRADEAGPIKRLSISNIRVSSDKLDDLMNLVSELVTMQASLSLFAENQHMPELTGIAENIEKISRQLRDNTFEICLIPIETIMIRFKRLVRDLSNELNKEIQFIAEGTETELDKSIIDGLTEPLMHIFRNAIDHGIESAEERLAKGKPRQGKIVLKAYYSGTNVYIQIKDDGKGIDVEKIRQKAISRGFISAEANLSYKELLNLVFLPGFSTAAKITEVSGRGVGLDVVVKKITDIRGDVEIESQLGIGTTFTIKLPLTLSIIDGLLVKIDSTNFVLPLSYVDKCFEITQEQIKSAFNNKIFLDGKMVPLVNLREEFNIKENSPDLHQIIQVNHDDFKIGMSVDVVLGEYQAVLKPLGRMFKDLEIISGATILGDGTIALVLDPGKIINTFDRETLLKREKLYKSIGKKMVTE